MIVPGDMVLVGTCGSCGGPVLSPQAWGGNSTNQEPPAQCGSCGREAKPQIQPAYGPLREML